MRTMFGRGRLRVREILKGNDSISELNVLC